jgi:Fe-S-cluster containining protein
MEDNITPISIDEQFQFQCTSDVACFNACCRDLNQFLTPYDILRLKIHLGLRSGEFIEKYTTQHIGPETGLPVLILSPVRNADLQCPFVTACGCSVYVDRPSSCRVYPVARAISRNRKTGKVSEHFALIREPHCLGFQRSKIQTVRQWLKAQALGAYNQLNDMFLEIISLKNRYRPGPLDLRSKLIFHIALYDLDAFREQILHNSLVEDLNLDPGLLEVLKNDEVELLKFGHRYVKEQIFGEKDASESGEYRGV